jgi:hypothetical protein
MLDNKASALRDIYDTQEGRHVYRSRTLGPAPGVDPQLRVSCIQLLHNQQGRVRADNFDFTYGERCYVGILHITPIQLLASGNEVYQYFGLCVIDSPSLNFSQLVLTAVPQSNMDSKSSISSPVSNHSQVYFEHADFRRSEP